MFGTVDTGKGWRSQVCPRAIGGIDTCHKMRHSLPLPTVTYICMGELPHFHHGPTTSFLHSQPIQTPPSGPLAKCSFGMIPLSHHSVDRSPRAFHSSTKYNVVRASCFEVVRASVESRKLFLDGSLCLAGKGVTMHRCIDASRYLGRRYVYRIATQVSRYFFFFNISHTWLLALFALFVTHTQRGLCCASFFLSFKGTFG